MLIKNQVQTKDQVNPPVLQTVKTQNISSPEELLLQNVSEADLIVDDVALQGKGNYADTINNLLQSKGFFNGLSKSEITAAKSNVSGLVDEMFDIQYIPPGQEGFQPNILWDYLINTNEYKDLVENLHIKTALEADSLKRKELGAIFGNVVLRDLYKAKGYPNNEKWIRDELNFALNGLSNGYWFQVIPKFYELRDAINVLFDKTASAKDKQSAKVVVMQKVDDAKKAQYAYWYGGKYTFVQGFSEERTDTMIDYLFKYSDALGTRKK